MKVTFIQEACLMNIGSILPVSTILFATSLLLPISASASGDNNIYRGGGYQVSICTDGSYYGCNPKRQCIRIKNYSYRNRGQYIWENKGITYSMTPLHNRQGAYRLKVISQRQQIFVNQIVKCDC
jgi:hypothetical protein